MDDLPVLRDLAVFDSADTDPLGDPFFAGRLDAAERAAVGAATGEARHDDVALCHLLFDDSDAIGNSARFKSSRPSQAIVSMGCLPSCFFILTQKEPQPVGC